MFRWFRLGISVVSAVPVVKLIGVISFLCFATYHFLLLVSKS